MNVCKMNDCDWMVGPSLEACIEAYRKDFCDDVEEAYALEATELEETIFTDGANKNCTFREQLEIEIKNGGAFPRLFASTDF